MEPLSFSYHNIASGQGFELAFAGMIIVFTALVLVTLFIALLPKALVVVNRLIPEAHLHTAPPPQRQSDDDAAIAAAVGFALHARQQTR